MLSRTEENYLKAILHLTVLSGEVEVGTNKLAKHLEVKPATVSDMAKKLKEKELVNYEKYGKISLTTVGRKHGMEVIRKHRLWETFLYEKLAFSWDEVHEVAEQLEHIKSNKLVDALDQFLDYPKFDPHGDAIPTKEGEVVIPYSRLLSEIKVGKKCKVIAVKDNSTAFLQYADKIGLAINDELIVEEIEPFDQMLTLNVNNELRTVSSKFAENIFVVCLNCKAGKDCSRMNCDF